MKNKSLNKRTNYIVKSIFTIFLLSCFFTLSGCGIRPRNVEVRTNIASMANQNEPVAVDLLLITDKQLVKDLLKVPANEWFAKRNQYKQDYPDQLIEGGSWEWVPGQNIPIQMLALTERNKVVRKVIPKRFQKIQAVIIYANYSTPGAHRVRLAPYQDIKINLMENDFTVELVK